MNIDNKIYELTKIIEELRADSDKIRCVTVLNNQVKTLTEINRRQSEEIEYLNNECKKLLNKEYNKRMCSRTSDISIKNMTSTYDTTRPKNLEDNCFSTVVVSFILNSIESQ